MFFIKKENHSTGRSLSTTAMEYGDGENVANNKMKQEQRREEQWQTCLPLMTEKKNSRHKKRGTSSTDLLAMSESLKTF